MKRKRYTEEQIVRILKEVEAGISVAEVCRRYGVTEQTVYRWKSKFTGMGVDMLKEYKRLREENRRLKNIVAEQALDIKILKDVNSKNW